jgi:hypothetical protein
LVCRGGPFSIGDVEGILLLATAEIPLPPDNPDERDKGLRRLSAKAQRARPSSWLINSSALIRGLIVFLRNRNLTGVVITLDGLRRFGWEPIIIGLAKRIEAALESNLPPADLNKLGPEARKLLAELAKRKK